MENLNAEQIIKALRGHIGVVDMRCEECPYNQDNGSEICINLLITDALALINSQEQRIGELAEEVEDLKVALLARTMALTTLKAVKEKLTEENERLTRLANLRQRDLDNANDLLFKTEDENERLRAARDKFEEEYIEATKQFYKIGVNDMKDSIEALFPSDKKFTTISIFTLVQTAKKLKGE